ncbi:hypothetical protein ISG29_20345 [Nocardioides sp. CBS4Y-1]|uniref:Transposase n=1 Tax=Nocardioides acrostichi TaxID=2784339 RepID=A0A930YF23_9ACTN|nr:hypothetical protein [Nocardioides acrostichi]
MKEDEAIRLKTLEQENARLKRIVAEQALGISMLKDVEKGTSMPGSSARRGRDADPQAQGQRTPCLPAGRAAPILESLRAQVHGFGGEAGREDARAGW